MSVHLMRMTPHWQLISASTQLRYILSGRAVLASLPILLEAWSSNSTARHCNEKKIRRGGRECCRQRSDKSDKEKIKDKEESQICAHRVSNECMHVACISLRCSTLCHLNTKVPPREEGCRSPRGINLGENGLHEERF